MSNARNKFSPEVRERAVRMVGEHRADYGSEWAATAATSSTPTWWEQFASNQSATASLPANDSATVLIDGLASLKQELSDLRDEQRIASATIASGTSKTARILERVTPDGDALAVRTAA